MELGARALTSGSTPSAKKSTAFASQTVVAASSAVSDAVGAVADVGADAAAAAVALTRDAAATMLTACAAAFHRDAPGSAACTEGLLFGAPSGLSLCLGVGRMILRLISWKAASHTHMGASWLVLGWLGLRSPAPNGVGNAPSSPAPFSCPPACVVDSFHFARSDAIFALRFLKGPPAVAAGAAPALAASVAVAATQIASLSARAGASICDRAGSPPGT
jgi:hypothetical protein